MNVLEKKDRTSTITCTHDEFNLIKKIIVYESQNYSKLDWALHERSAAQFTKLRQALETVPEKTEPVALQMDEENRQTLNQGIYYAASMLDEIFEADLALIENLWNSLIPSSGKGVLEANRNGP